MAWEYRGSRLYYYRKIRRDRQVVSEYVGAGEVAELICVLEGSDKYEQRKEREAWKEEKAEMLSVDQDIEQLNTVIRRLVLATVLVSGFHPHKGQWRRNRYV